MRLIVEKENVSEVLKHLETLDTIILDTETSGLSAYQGAKMFSLSISSLQGDSWYFDFKEKLEYADLKPLFEHENPARIWVGHNIKFDLSMLDKAGLYPQFGDFVDTKALARMYQNQHGKFGGDRQGYSLDACAKRWLDVRKDDRVKTWMKENYAYEASDGGGGEPNYFFDLVPFDIISEYAMIDTEVTAKLYTYLTENMYPGNQMVEVEMKLGRILYEMEKTGLKIDGDYVKKAKAAEVEILKETISHLPKDFVDSAKYLAPLLIDRGFEVPQTEKGNDQVTDFVLRSKPDELAENVLRYREYLKRVGTYWDNYLCLVDSDEHIHPTLDSSGTVTGRMASYNPNFQNIPAEDDSEFPVRRSIVAEDGETLVSIDFRNMELRAAFCYGGETDVMAKIQTGYDPHQATADQTGLTRQQAKTLSFATVYGSGVKRLAAMMDVTENQAREFKNKYFDALPGVNNLIYSVKKRAKSQGFVTTWSGRRLHLEDSNSEFKMPNHLIQGSCADIVKVAMINIQPLLKANNAKLLLQVHDELIISVPDENLKCVTEIARVMAEDFNYPLLSMACSIEVGKNFHDMQPFEDATESAAGVSVSDKGFKETKIFEKHMGL